jgi:hypothetical protein
MSEQNRRRIRFPVPRMEYSKVVGKLLPEIIAEILTEFDFRVKVNHQQANGVDLEAYLDDELILVAEVLNWSIGSRLTNKRRDKIIRNLSEFDCGRLLIHTVPLSNLDGIDENGICRVELGYQVLPKDYYDFFLARSQVIRRKIDSDSTRREIKAKILHAVLVCLFLELEKC